MVASIKYIENIISTFGRASEANADTPGRTGQMVTITPEIADNVMITGDLHGHRRNFNAIRKMADLKGNPRRHLVLQEVCHGGMVYPENGGCMSHTLLEDVAKLKTMFPDRVHFVLGNHELAELTEYPIHKNKQMLNLMFRLGLQQAYGPASEKIREAYRPFLESCPLAIRLPGGVFVSHSIPENCDEQPFDKTILTRPIDSSEYYTGQEIFDLVWGRDYREENARAFAELVDAKVLINGHDPCPAGFKVPNDTQIILDCCDDKASYLILPTQQELTHAQIVDRIQPLT